MWKKREYLRGHFGIIFYLIIKNFFDNYLIIKIKDEMFVLFQLKKTLTEKGEKEKKPKNKNFNKLIIIRGVGVGADSLNGSWRAERGTNG